MYGSGGPAHRCFLSSPWVGGTANKHKPWIEAEYQGIVMENDNPVLLNPPLFALDKDAPLRYAGDWGWGMARWVGQRKSGWEGRRQGRSEEVLGGRAVEVGKKLRQSGRGRFNDGG